MKHYWKELFGRLILLMATPLLGVALVVFCIVVVITSILVDPVFYIFTGKTPVMNFLETL
jgi:hypothetical protein